MVNEAIQAIHGSLGINPKKSMILLCFSEISLRNQTILTALFNIKIDTLMKFLLLMMLSTTAMASDVKNASSEFENFRDCDVCSEMVAIPSGEYLMGSSKEEFNGEDQYKTMYQDETPQHPVTVKSFGIAKYDVTRQQFAIFSKETGFKSKGCYTFKGKNWLVGRKHWFFDKTADWKNPGFKQAEQDPVVCVSWNDTQKFIIWINTKVSNKNSGKYRLPTEEEWEYAARAGTVTPMYWGGDRSEQCKFENTRDLSKEKMDPIGPYVDCDSGYAETSPVGSFHSNPWGLFDMLGNVYQWVSDCNSLGYANQLPATPEVITISCSYRRTRGASWATIPIGVRSASRGASKFDTPNSTIGFRLAVNLPN